MIQVCIISGIEPVVEVVQFVFLEIIMSECRFNVRVC